MEQTARSKDELRRGDGAFALECGSPWRRLCPRPLCWRTGFLTRFKNTAWLPLPGNTGKNRGVEEGSMGFLGTLEKVGAIHESPKTVSLRMVFVRAVLRPGTAGRFVNRPYKANNIF